MCKDAMNMFGNLLEEYISSYIGAGQYGAIPDSMK